MTTMRRMLTCSQVRFAVYISRPARVGTGADIGVGAGKFLEALGIFGRISSNLLEKVVCGNANFLSQK